jgi:tetratricopeptide (TPR) repeat protein/tRNA A-37 threonylcarbamoyl transferase component Bud32
MLCTFCGATSSSVLDRCAVCHTPFPPGIVNPATSRGTAGGASDPSSAATAETRLSQADPRVSQADTRVGAGDTRAFGGDTQFGQGETRLSQAGITQPGITSGSRPVTADAGGVPILQAGQTFANRYTIIRLLGAGGMAAVYQAWDESLGSAVALKLIRIDPTMQPADIRQLEERFKRELKLARQVTHANVVRIHDLGEVGSTLYLTMAYVQGSDLATLIRQGRMPVPRALSLARQIVAGLAAAHKAGVVHRDLKPANIMVDADDHALLTDFGIARSTTAMTVHTMPGAIIGTLEYMAPEQARGEPADERTDIYALGLILYEMLAGGRPRGKSEGGLSELIARLQQGPPPIRTVAEDVPPDVERIVTRCLKPDPAARYATADELLADLESLDAEGRMRLHVRRYFAPWKIVVGAAVAGVLLVLATWWAASRQQPVEPAAARAPVPVLIVDFENRAQEPVFDGALEQALSIAMEGAPFVTAFPRKDAADLVRRLKFGDRLNEQSGLLLAKREGIRVILAGAIERDGAGYRIAVRAVDPDKPASEPPIAMAEARAADKGAVLGAVGHVAEDVREALGDATPAAQQQAETFTAASLDAVREYTIAQGLATNQKDEEAIAHYQAAIKHDKEFGRAYAGLALSLYYLGRGPEAEKQWKEALQRTDRMTEREKLRTSGTYFAAIARNPEKAIEAYDELVRKYPADSAGHNNLAVAHFSTLNFAKALEHGQKAIDIYPRSFKFRANYALYAMYFSDFAKAAATAQQLIKEDPTFETAYLPLAMSAVASGDVSRARAAYEAATKGGDAGASLAALGTADLAMYQGQYDAAIASLPPAIKRDQDQQNAFGAVAKLLALAEAHAARGQQPAALAALQQAAKLGDDDSVLVTSSRLHVAAGRSDQARTLAARLNDRVAGQSRAYAKLIEAEIAMAARRYPEALDALNAARKLADLWLVRFDSGLAYFHRGDYTEAASEFAKCQERRGEATALFLDDLPTIRYYAPVPYWLGRAREMSGLDPRTQYEEFLSIRGGAAGDPLVQDAQRRLAALKK